MPHAIVLRAFGGPEQLRYEEITVGEPEAGEVRLRHTAIGMNLMEVGLRIGAYPGPPLPFVPGIEGVGIIEALGADVSGLAVGQRVGYASLPIGSYASARLFPADRLIPLPDDIGDEVAAAVMVKGMTAEYMLRRTCDLQPGMTILVHAAAGATGLMLCQLAHHLGATVFGTVSSDSKAEFVRAHGCHHPIVYSRENFADRVLALTGGQGVDVAYDSVGRDTFDDTVRCTAPLGLVGLFGVASGLPEPINLMAQDLYTSRRYVRPSLYAHTRRREDLLAIAASTFGYVRNGVMKVEINARLPLADAAEAHRRVEARKTTGSLVLLP